MALVSVFRESLLPQSTREESLDKFFAGPKSRWQLTWDELMASVMKFGPGVELQPTDTYIGLTRNGKKFAVVATTAARMDVGLKLKGGAELDAQLTGWLREAFDRVG